MFEDIINTPKKPEIIRIFTCNYNVQTQCPGYSADQMAVCKFLGLAGRICLWSQRKMRNPWVKQDLEWP